MGRGMSHADQDLPYAQNTSETSKRTALRQSVHLDTKGSTSNTQKTKRNKLTLEPITAVHISKGSNAEDKDHQGSAKKVRVFEDEMSTTSRRILPSLTPSYGQNGVSRSDASGDGTSQLVLSSKHSTKSGVQKNKNRVKTLKTVCSEMSRQTYVPPRSLQLDENVFTFRPRVSSASTRIAESLGTDFMSRQQLHIEKQKKFLDQPDKVSHFPVHPATNQRQQDIKEPEDLNNGAVTKDFDVDAAQQESVGPKDQGNNNTHAEEAEEQEAHTKDPMFPSQSVSQAASSMELQSTGLQRLLSGPYAVNASEAALKKKKQISWFPGSDTIPKRKLTPDGGPDKENELSKSLTRSKTMPMLGQPKLKGPFGNDGERLRAAKEMVDKAIKYHKVFTIQGGYSSIRCSLRRRGWVEKFFKIPDAPKKTHRAGWKKHSDDDDDDDDDDDTDDDDDDNDQPKIPPWEEEDGFYGIMSRTDLIRMSRLLKNTDPSLFWVLKRDVIDHRFLNKDQLVNHYSKAGSFTTKVGLCVNIKNTPWFEPVDHDQFFPRCYRLSHDEDKISFINDFRLTACMNILKLVLQMKDGSMRNEGGVKVDNTSSGASTPCDKAPESEKSVSQNPECTHAQAGSDADGNCGSSRPSSADVKATTPDSDSGENNTTTNRVVTPIAESARPKSATRPRASSARSWKRRMNVPYKILELAVLECQKFLAEREHEDIDRPPENDMPESQWDDLIQWYYVMAHKNGVIASVPESMMVRVESLINRLRTKCPQFDIDGTRNVWIVKPGAKSRGRGIMCYDHLGDMLKLVSSQVVKKDSKYVVQKYLERPLLIYNTKFDIRQWFLVTDWNPLTVWFYQDSYLRFCSRQFTLEDFDQAVHLSNNAIQKHYKNGPRSRLLPEENMWTHEEFKKYLRIKKMSYAWDEIIYPGMKQAIICSLLCTQDLVECRKSSFELYGADFMLSEDLQPWLIEINSSPSMEASTSVTARLCHRVLDDTIKVVIDRRYDKNCGVGRFELAYKQPVVTVPPYVGITLCVEGQALRKPAGFVMRRSMENNPTDSLISQRFTITQRTSVEKVEDAAVKKISAISSVSSNSSGVKSSIAAKQEDEACDNQSPTRGLTRVGSVVGDASKFSLDMVPSPTAKPGRTLSMGSTSKINQTVEHEATKMSPEAKGLNSQAVMTSRLYTQSMLVGDLGSKRVVSRTSVSTNYTIPTSQSTSNMTQSQLTVNNVESTDLRTFKAAKGRRRRKKQAYFGGLRYTHRGVPTKLAPYLPATSVRKLPPVKVHILNTHVDLSPFLHRTPDKVAQFDLQRYHSRHHPSSQHSHENVLVQIQVSGTSQPLVPAPAPCRTSRDCLPVAHGMELATKAVG